MHRHAGGVGIWEGGGGEKGATLSEPGDGGYVTAGVFSVSRTRGMLWSHFPSILMVKVVLPSHPEG